MSTDDAIDLTQADDDSYEQLQQQLLLVEDQLQELEQAKQQLRIREQLLRQQKEDLQRRMVAEQQAPKADWTSQFSWGAHLQQALQEVFALTSFRPLQREVMNATLQGRDVLLLLPSGGGKSLCYQLPAAVRGGVTLVVSPLLSLIVDQVMALAGKVQAYALTSMTSKEESAQVMAALTAAAAGGKQPARNKAAAGAAASAAKATTAAPAAEGPCSDGFLLYVTPEKIVASKRLMAKLEKVYQAGKLSRVAIDEAHCCSSWGNDFRPDYKKLGVLKQQFPQTPIIALTATATAQVCGDIMSILRINGAERFSASINRPNLSYEVRRKPASAEVAVEDICSWIRDNYPKGESGIIYCLTRKDCETLASQLQDAGISAAHYHADMDPALRVAAHEAWSCGAVQVIVATVAFGMGINKPDVSFVLHACIAKSLENYYQESGRAGRDGQPARCVLYYRLSDVLRQAALVCMDPTWDRHLMAVTSYAVGITSCRRAALAAHFGEAAPICNQMCDLCQAAAASKPQRLPGEQPAATAATTSDAIESASALATGSLPKQGSKVDITSTALLVITAIKGRKNEQRATLNQLLDDLPKRSKRAADGHIGSSSAGGAASGTVVADSKDQQERIIEHMLLHGLLSIDFSFTPYTTNSYLVVSPAGEAFAAAAGNSRLLMAMQPHDQVTEWHQSSAEARKTKQQKIQQQ